MELKPCPFCATNTSLESSVVNRNVWINCLNCGYEATLPEYNNRPIEETLEKQNAALREALESIMCVHNSNFGSYIKEVNFIAEQALKKGESGE